MQNSIRKMRYFNKPFSKMVAIILIIAMVVVLPISAMASPATDENGFVIDNGVLTGYSGPGGDITIPSIVTSIGDGAFSQCPSLASVIIPNGVTSIGYTAFADCINLVRVDISSSVTSIASNDAFDGCNKLTQINVDTSNANYSSKDGVLFNKDKTVLLKYPAGKTDTIYDIPSSVTKIDDCAFFNCKNLENISFPSGLIIIGDCAFGDCTGLTRADIPASVTTIGIDDSCLLADGAFGGCTNLTQFNVAANNQTFSSKDGVLFNKDQTVLLQYPEAKTDTSYTIPDGVKILGQKDNNSIGSLWPPIFRNDKFLKSVIIPASVILIEDDALMSYNAQGQGVYNITLTVTAGSYAETYAKQNKIPYVIAKTSSDSPSGTQTGTTTTGTQTKEVTNSNGSVAVNYDPSALPSGVTVGSVKDVVVTSGTDATAIQSALSKAGYTNVSINDIQLLDSNGNPITKLAGNVTVKIKISADAEKYNLKVLWYDPSTGKLTDMNATQQDGYLVFTTNHFSYYVVAKAASPKTGDNNINAVVYFALTSIVSFMAIPLVSRLRELKTA